MTNHSKKEEQKKLIVRIVCIALAALMIVPVLVSSVVSALYY